MKIIKFYFSFLVILILSTITNQIKTRASQDSKKLSDGVDEKKIDTNRSNEVTNQAKIPNSLLEVESGLNSNVKSKRIDEANITPQNGGLKSTNYDFINTISKGISNIDKNAADTKSFNLNILIGNTNTTITNQNLRNVGSYNKN